MKDVKIIIDGKEYTAQMSDEQVKEIAKQERARTGYERVDVEQTYYARDTSVPSISFEYYNEHDNENFANGNYVNDQKLFKDRFRARVLHDRLEQWQALNDAPVDWGDKKIDDRWQIYYDYLDNEINAWSDEAQRGIGTVHFSTREKAQEAIEVFRDELMWYFTEYRSRLDEKRTGEESND